MMNGLSPDITIKDYYNHFINTSKVELYKEKEKLNKIIAVKENLHDYLTPRREEIHNKLGITLDNYIIEFTNKEYNPNNSLLNKAHYLFKQNDPKKDRGLIIKLLKYATSLTAEQECRYRITIIEYQCNLSFADYQIYIYNYYSRVHKVVLQGEGYKFNYEIGILHIDRFSVKRHKVRIDIAETNKNRRRLLEEGKELYNPALAKWYQERGIKYDGEEYRVTKIVNHAYKILITDSRYSPKFRFEFTPIRYINGKFKGLSLEEIAERYCKDVEDIYDIQCSLNVKLRLLLIKYPGDYVKFIRNESE